MLPHLQSFRERSCCLEALGLGCLGPLFFVDDVAAPYPDAASVDKVLSQGLGAFAKLARASFNFGPQKTASMACFDAPTAHEHVPVYKLLGVDLDKDLTFKHRLNVVLAMGQSAFEQFFHTAESAGFSVAVEAFEVPRRLEPLVLYGAKFN